MKRFGRAAAAISQRFRRDSNGGVLMPAALAIPLMMAGAGAVVDYGMLSKTRLDLQTAADAAALAGASEFRLANSTSQKIIAAAESFANSQLAKLNQQANVIVSADLKKMTVRVDIKTVQNTMIMHVFGSEKENSITASATAAVKGTAAICVIGLDPKENETIYMEKNAKLEAPNCAIYSNSTKSYGLKAKENSQINARFICTAGGKYSDKSDAFSPTPQTDCPVIPDPLMSREPPAVGGCTANNLKLTSSTTLYPGTYCGGIVIDKTAAVDMAPGVYIIKDGPLHIAGQAKINGSNVGFYLTGKGALLSFDPDTSISLTAPKTGPMSGMLFFEDRANKFGQKHDIMSNDAKILLGTIYLSGGELNIASNRPVAQDSAYTIIVARKFSLSAGPTMVMNTNYTGTDIPVPAGVGPGGSAPFLTQ